MTSTAPAVATIAGNARLPVPRSTLASALNIHSSTMPANNRLEYVSAASSVAPWPPISVYNARPAVSMITPKVMPSAAAMISACMTRALASAARCAPMARAMAEEIPPPIAPADIICISINAGNTRATPACASVPSFPTQYASIKPIDDCTSSKTIWGAASFNSVGTIGPSSRRRVRGSTVPELPAGASLIGARAGLCRWPSTGRRRHDFARHSMGGESAGVRSVVELHHLDPLFLPA